MTATQDTADPAVQANQLKWLAWDSAALLAALRPSDIRIAETLRQRIHDEMWRNLVAEYDASNLSRRLNDRCDLGGEFRTFEKLWLHDELNHYEGLLILYCAIYGRDRSVVDSQVRSRRPDFSDIADLLRDEFHLCVCFAYDELASARGYAQAFPLYDSFRVPEVSRWIRNAARDEMFHSINAQRLIKAVHGSKLPQVPNILRQIVAREHSSPDDYCATLLFDHGESEGDNPFSQSFLQKCANDVCRYLNTPAAFI